MLDFITKYFASCDWCQKRNIPTHRAFGPLQSFCTEHPWEIVTTDVSGPLPRSTHETKFIITATDPLIKCVVAMALHAQTTEAVARFLIFNVLKNYWCRTKFYVYWGTIASDPLNNDCGTTYTRKEQNWGCSNGFTKVPNQTYQLNSRPVAENEK